MSLSRIVLLIVLVVALAVGGTTWLLGSRGQTESRISVNYPEGVGAVVPLGISAGEAPTVSLSTANPLSSDPNAVTEGRKLFLSMNCAGCHGYDAKGGMGPNLTDTAWRYGGAPIDVYKSIYEGRPKGMPAWGNGLPPRPIWQLVAYIQSLGGTSSAPPPGEMPVAAVPPEGLGAQTGQKQ